jgi:hypothetical protein
MYSIPYDHDHHIPDMLVFSATFYNISVISWRSVALLEETGVPGENNQPNAKN